MSNILPKDYTIRKRYKVLRLIGQGGMGAVYLVRDMKEKGNIWAAKEFWHLHEAPLFSKEASLLMELSHKGLPAVIDYFTEEGKNYLIMERIEGLTLEDLVNKNGLHTAEQIIPWIFQLCDILDYLHTRNPPVIYRDLKPANVMLDMNNSIRLIDFGIARFYEPRKLKDTTPLGTPGYCPPEQYGRGQTSCRSDIYSLGATIYFLLTAQDPAEFKFKFPPIKKFNKKVCPKFEEIINKCLSPAPEHRFSKANNVKEAMEQWMEEKKFSYKNITSWIEEKFTFKKEKNKKAIISTETRFIDEERTKS